MFWIPIIFAVIVGHASEVRSYGQASQMDSSPEIDRIYLEDQQVRQPPNPNAPKPIYKSDGEREAATRKLIEEGIVKSGKDFEEAAVIFQHSHQPDDYLLAHSLAIIAVSKGNKNATWIASATLDRYLLAIGKPQIYGTQFMTPAGQHATQEPYNRKLISDQLRKDLRVPSQVDQEVRRREFDIP